MSEQDYNMAADTQASALEDTPEIQSDDAANDGGKIKAQHDIEESRRFLKALDPGATEFTFQTFNDKGRNSGYGPAIFHGTIDQHHAALVARNVKGQGVFVSVNRTDLKGRREGNLVAVRAAYQEDDNGFTGVFPISPSMTVESSPGKVHRYWLLRKADAEALKTARAVEERLVKEYGSDPAAKDVTRVLRVPGFYNTKEKYGAPQYIEILELNDSRYSWDEITKAFPPLVEKQKTKRTKLRSVPAGDAVPQELTGDDVPDLIKLRADLFTLDPGMNRDVWLNVLFACHSVGQYEMFQEWSARWSEYDDFLFHKEWKSPTRAGQKNTITFKTIHHMANAVRSKGVKTTTAQIKAMPNAKSKSVAIPAILLNPPGLVGDVANHFLTTAVRPQPIFAMSVALTTVSMVSSNKWLVDALKTPLALYTALIGGTASGKDGPRSAIKRALREVGLAESLVDAMASGPALMSQLYNSEDHLVCLLTDEFGKVLKSGASHGDTLQTDYMSVYGRGNDWYDGKSYAKSENNIPAYYGPYLNIVGTTTKAALVEALTSLAVVDGFLNRFLLVVPPDALIPMKQTIPAKGMPDVLKTRLVNIHEAAGINDEPVGILYEDGVMDMCTAYSAKVDKLGDSGELTAPLWGRAFQNSLAVAGILALGVDGCDLAKPIITKDIYEWATTYVDWCCESACALVVDHIADDKEERDRKKIFKFVKECANFANEKGNSARLQTMLLKGLAPRAWVNRKTRLAKKVIDDAIATLYESEHIEITHEKAPNNREVPMYRALK